MDHSEIAVPPDGAEAQPGRAQGGQRSAASASQYVYQGSALGVGVWLDPVTNDIYLSRGGGMHRVSA